jgi:hypothetical protein
MLIHSCETCRNSCEASCSSSVIWHILSLSHMNTVRAFSSRWRLTLSFIDTTQITDTD